MDGVARASSRGWCPGTWKEDGDLDGSGAGVRVTGPSRPQAGRHRPPRPSRGASPHGWTRVPAATTATWAATTSEVDVLLLRAADSGA